MSDDAAERLERWGQWLPQNASHLEQDELFYRWEHGIEPPDCHYTSDWMNIK